MEIKLILDDWKSRVTGESVYQTKQGAFLTIGSFHSGTTFDASISLDAGDAEELLEALSSGYIPIFILSIPK